MSLHAQNLSQDLRQSAEHDRCTLHIIDNLSLTGFTDFAVYRISLNPNTPVILLQSPRFHPSMKHTVIHAAVSNIPSGDVLVDAPVPLPNERCSIGRAHACLSEQIYAVCSMSEHRVVPSNIIIWVVFRIESHSEVILILVVR